MFNIHRAREIEIEIGRLLQYNGFREHVAGMKRERSVNLALIAGIQPDVDVIQFFHSHEKEIPNWAAAAFKMALIQPSATAERVFSLLKNSFGERQCCTLLDAHELGVMMSLNRK